MMPTESTEATKRDTLTHARRATKAKAGALVAVALVMARAFRLHAFRDDPWLILVAFVPLGLAARSLVQYRRLRTELGLHKEYDELDENTTMLGKTLLTLFGVFGGIFLLVVLFIWAAGKR